MTKKKLFKGEKEIYQFWEKSGFFTPKVDKKKKPFVIVLPPPNVTGELHVGHAFEATIQDILIRYHQMKGTPTLWLPGVDHGGIATHYVLEKELAKEGKTRFDLGREKFLQRMWRWIDEYGLRIDEQLKRLGGSLDWSRKRFTLDEGYQEAVKVAFQKLQDDDLVYWANRIVNWCPRCQTALSDLENVHKEEEGNFYFLDYKTLKIATTRPETIFADIAVAVNPKDKRYKNLNGKEAQIPLIEKKIPIIADELVNPDFGTGALKITPAHDELDFQIWQNHKRKLKEAPRVINPQGFLEKNKLVPKIYWGLNVLKAREAVVADLKKNSYIEKIEKIKHAPGRCYRCNTLNDPQISKQLFVKMAPLAKPAIEAVRSGQIKIIPHRFEKIYFNWMENIEDWCISRQIWWGHEIPGTGDVFDTWFSSSLWPFATLGWPKKTEDFNYFYPTTVMDPGYEILFFWVARMIMMGIYLTQDIPFKIVFLHGIVRDVMGKKMSKTLGNVLDPLILVNKYGADALRMGLVAGTAQGNDVRLYEEKITSYRNFVTKIRNIGRFVIDLRPKGSVHLGGIDSATFKVKHEDDRWIKTELEKTTQAVIGYLEKFQLHLAAELVYQFVWHKFADVYIEKSKNRRGDAQPVLEYVLKNSLILLHPFMPFVTEEIYQQFANKKKSIMLERWPVANS